MARKENTVGAEVLPCSRQIRNVDAPVFIFLVYMRLVAEPINTLWRLG